MCIAGLISVTDLVSTRKQNCAVVVVSGVNLAPEAFPRLRRVIAVWSRSYTLL